MSSVVLASWDTRSSYQDWVPRPGQRATRSRFERDSMYRCSLSVFPDRAGGFSGTVTPLADPIPEYAHCAPIIQTQTGAAQGRYGKTRIRLCEVRTIFGYCGNCPIGSARKWALARGGGSRTGGMGRIGDPAEPAGAEMRTTRYGERSPATSVAQDVRARCRRLSQDAIS